MEGGRVSVRPIYRGVIAIAERQHAVLDVRDSWKEILAGRWYHGRLDDRLGEC
jgi:hypothetical protein